jgi:hypothetical protein
MNCELKMEYPQSYFNRMFGEMRSLELARRFAIYSGALLFLAICVAAAIFWAHRSQSAKPYFLYASPDGEWLVYSEGGGAEAAMHWSRLIQESVAVNYASAYFRVSGNPVYNNNVLWRKCDDGCDGDQIKNSLCCAGDKRAFEYFLKNILPGWQERFKSGETLDLENIAAAPIGEASERGGFWRLTGDLVSNKSRTKKITGFVKIDRGQGVRPETLGFYVSEFNWYPDR